MKFGFMKAASSSDEGDEEKDGPQVPEPLGAEEYPTLEKRIGYRFKDYQKLQTALTHRSAHIKGNEDRNDYERLEYLGDAVLDLAVAHLLLDRHKQAREGALSKMRAALVNTVSLAEIAVELGLGRYIILSRGELANGGSERPSILADVLEAVIGAVYQEGGYDTALKVIEGFFGDNLVNVDPHDPKTELQEALHAVGSEPPTYLLECVEGPEHAPNFVSVVEIDGQIVGRGEGTTKKASQQAAAAEVLERLAEENAAADAPKDKE